MLFQWSEYLNLAQYLKEHPNVSNAPEAAYRCAISRAYYATYHSAYKYACRFPNFIPQKGIEHDDLVKYFKYTLGNITSKWKLVGNRLGILKRWRHHCDYSPEDLGEINLKASKAIDFAQFIIDNFRERRW
ncbi:MAG: hypothetical protein U9Q76_00710 [candidate division WOR-3 bacterium]|nr:hypothetical protein [candidate division WOR-3 bacterium]